MSFSAPARSAPAPSHGQLGLWDTVSIIVGIVIGTTIFELPWLIFDNTPNAWMGLAVWVFGGFLALVGGLCYAELATTYPRSGGDYHYLTQAFGRWVGFLFGWAQLSVVLPASIGVMVFVFANIATSLQPFPDVFNLGLNSEFYYAASAVLAITLLNILGVVLGKIAQNVLAAAKVLGLIGILVAGLMTMQPELTNWTFPDASKPEQWGWEALAIILVMYAFGGWNDAAFVAAEVRDRRRNIPLALLAGIGAITVIYVLVNAAYLLGLGFNQARSPGSLPTQLMENAFGEHGVWVMSVIIMASALGAANGLILTGSRVYATLGKDHRLFGFLGGWRPGAGTPIVALIIQALITLGFVYLFGSNQGHEASNQFLDWLNQSLSIHIDYRRDWAPRDAFNALVSHSAPAFWLFFLLTGFSLFLLREKNKHLERPFSVPLYPLIPIIFCLSCTFMLYRATIYIEWRTLFVVALLLLGLPLFLLSQSMGIPSNAESER
ncbi:MAG: amino acid permease [Gemmataceae bacterium]|nr:amino acid permease [Gemmataceae bacterium]